MTLAEVTGWIGAVLVLVAYYMVSTGKAKGDSKLFQLINISGAIFLVYYTFNCKAYASMIVNIIWVAIGASSFIKFIKLKPITLQRKVKMSTKFKMLMGIICCFAVLSIAHAQQTAQPQSSSSSSSIEDDDSESSSTPSTYDESSSSESSDDEISEESDDE